MVTDDHLTAAGGWCAPSAVIFDAAEHARAALDLPRVSVPRGGITFPDWSSMSPQARRAHEAYQAMIRRHADAALTLRRLAVDEACVTAARNGWDVHVHEPIQDIGYGRDLATYRLRYVGIEFTPAAHPIPTIVIHRDEDHTDLWDDDEPNDDGPAPAWHSHDPRFYA